MAVGFSQWRCGAGRSIKLGCAGGGGTGAGETARGANRPPTAAAGKGVSLTPLGWGTLPFLLQGLSGLPACSFRPNIAPTRPSTHPHPPHLTVLAIPTLEGTLLAPSVKCMYPISMFGVSVGRNLPLLLYGPYWHQPRQYEQVMYPAPRHPHRQSHFLSINPSHFYLAPSLLPYEYIISVVSPLLPYIHSALIAAYFAFPCLFRRAHFKSHVCPQMSITLIKVWVLFPSVTRKTKTQQPHIRQ